MSTVTTKDGTQIYFKDWGPKTAQPLVFHHGWPALAAPFGGSALNRALKSLLRAACGWSGRSAVSTYTTALSPPTVTFPSATVSALLRPEIEKAPDPLNVSVSG